MSGILIVAIDAPPHLSVVERANRLGRTLHIRYVNDRGEVRDRTPTPAQNCAWR